MDTLDNLITGFSVDKLKQFFRQKINTFKPDEEDYEYLFEDNENISDNYEDIVKIGEADLINSDDLLVITAKTLAPLTNKTGKKRQFEIAKKILKEENKDAAFFIFYNENSNFRFSLIRANFLGVKKDFTDFKRYTYFVSCELTNKTFINQISKADFNDLDSILEAFSVEPLNKQFYEQIAEAFYGLIGGKIGTGNKSKEYNAVLKLPDNDIKTNRKIYQEFAVRLIGRTIFVWFLKNKTSENSLPLIPNDWLTSQKIGETQNYYHTLLEKLFFDILNKPIDERIENLPEGHEIIPFLNGGLFEPGHDDFYEAGFSGFSKFNNTLKIPDDWIFNLFETLEQFNFTIDENSLNDQEVSIDPEMLGTIFENLLAEIDPDTEKSARKSTGSFYTPREIVDYMVEESLVSYLKTKTNTDEKILHNLFKENDLPEDYFENKKQLINAFNEIKILDPACGSGAFPMGALHKINLALQKLDPDAEIWKEKQLEKIDNIAYRKALKDKLDKSNVEYIRKLGIIQHSIYGMDIQSIATEISKLRSFLSLVVDENINDEAKNRGIYPLPNLEFKFVTANTLIGLEQDQKGNTISMDFGDTGNDIENLQKKRDEYLQTYGEDKEKLKQNFIELQKEIAQKEFSSGGVGVNKKAQQIIGWNPFNHEKSDWFDPKWMFGVGKFDVVVGNPPYIQLQKSLPNGNGLKYADVYKKENYKTFERTGDIYALFYEKGINILTNKGLLCYITSNKWMRANYGKSLRKFFSEKNPLKLIDLGPGIFNTATVDTNILLIENNVKTHNCASLQAITLTDKEKINTLNNDGFITLNNLFEDSWIILSPEEQNIKQKIERIGTPLNDWDINIYRGVLTGYNEAFIIDGKTKDELIAQDPKSAEIIKPILRGRDIKRYKAEYADLWLIATLPARNLNINDYPAVKKHLEQFLPKIKQTGETFIDINGQKQKTRKKTGNKWFETQDQIAYWEEFEKEKIIFTKASKEQSFTFINSYEFLLQTAYLATGKNLKFILTLLNSVLINFCYNKFYQSGGVDGEITYQAIIIIPIPKIPRSEQKPFETLVDKIISKKEASKDTTAEEKQIDLMVYKLYELTYEEVKIIEPEFSLTEKEYFNYEL